MHSLSHRFCVAPMIDWTDKHCRFFHRLLSQHALLYTEMITTGAILFGERDHILGYHAIEHPVALQLGGADPKSLAECAKIGEDYGYDEINLNVGCPSDRVQSGKFGACLMAEPELVADCISAMQARVNIPVTVKTRIGIDDSAEKDFLWRFIDIVKSADCQTFIIHARKAWLKGLSPKENREIPPLRYDIAAELKKDFRDCKIILNGGILSIEESINHLKTFDGVMLGRAAYHHPYLLSEVDQKFFGSTAPVKTRAEIIQAMIVYCKEQMQDGVALHAITRHILGLWHGEPGARKIRQTLSDHKISAAEKLAFLGSLIQ